MSELHQVQQLQHKVAKQMVYGKRAHVAPSKLAFSLADVLQLQVCCPE